MSAISVVFLVSLMGAASATAGTGWKRHIIDNSARGADGVRLADVNGDGRPDITTGWEQGGTVRAYLNPGPSKSKEKWPGVTVGEAPNVEDAVFADLDGDGAVDVVSSCEGETRTHFVHWAPSRKIELPAGSAQFKAVGAGDVDGDGKVDLVVSFVRAKNKPGLIWLSHDGSPFTGRWSAHQLSGIDGVKHDVVALADLDGDGDLDAITTEEVTNLGVIWYENPSKL